MRYTTFFTLSFLSSVVFLSACGGPKDIDKIAEAQNCLNNATTSQVSDCVSKVDGMESQAAYRIRCVGKLAKEGFNSPSKIATALTASQGGGTNGSLAMMAALAFKSESTNAANAASAEEALNYCTTSKSKGLILLAGLARTSTSLASLGTGVDLANLDASDLSTLMNTLKTDPNAQAAVGSAVVAIYDSNCQGDGETTGDFCQQFDAVVNQVGGTTNSAAIGELVMVCYTTPADPRCTGFN